MHGLLISPHHQLAIAGHMVIGIQLVFLFISIA